MGIPYSREINAAFEQVTPLVAAGFKVLQTTRNISILLLVLQVLAVLFLGLAVIVGLGVLVCVNDDLVEERKALVTPVLKWILHLSLWQIIRGIIGFTIVSGVFGGMCWWFFVVLDGERRLLEEEGVGKDEDEKKEKEKAKKGEKKKGKNEED